MGVSQTSVHGIEKNKQRWGGGFSIGSGPPRVAAAFTVAATAWIHYKPENSNHAYSIGTASVPDVGTLYDFNLRLENRLPPSGLAYFSLGIFYENIPQSRPAGILQSALTAGSYFYPSVRLGYNYIFDNGLSLSISIGYPQTLLYDVGWIWFI